MIDVSLCVICGEKNIDEANVLFLDAKQFVREIVCVTTASVEKSKSVRADVVESRTDLVDEDGCPKSFSKLRDASFALATRPWRMWVDTDDVVDSWEALGEIVEKCEFLRRSDKRVAVSFQYDYSWNHDRTQCLQTHPRERLVHRDDGWKWTRPVHECMRTDRTDVYEVLVESPRIVHVSEGARGVLNDRNLKILRAWSNGEHDDNDPIALNYYIADELLARNKFSESRDFFVRAASHARDEKKRNWIDRSIFRAAIAMYNEENVEGSRDFLIDSISIDDDPPENFFALLAMCHGRLGSIDKAEETLSLSVGQRSIVGEDPTFSQRVRRSVEAQRNQIEFVKKSQLKF